MTIEQEARDIVFEMDLHGEGEIKSAIKGIAKALKAKQDRIDELELALSGRTVSCSNCNQLTIERDVEIKRARIAERLVKELEEKVREYKNEWESACERWRATNERVKDLELEFEKYKKNNNAQKWNALLAKRMDHIKALDAKLLEYHNAYEGKKHRIYELESALKEIIDLEHYDSLKDDTQELMVNLAKKALGGASCE